MTHEAVKAQMSSPDERASIRKNNDGYHTRFGSEESSDLTGISSISLEASLTQKTSEVAERTLSRDRAAAVCSPKWTRPPPLSPVQKKLLFSTMSSLGKSNSSLLYMDEISADTPPKLPPWPPENEQLVEPIEPTTAGTERGPSFSSLKSASSYSSVSSTEESPRPVPKRSLSHLRSPRKAPFSPRGSSSSTPSLFQQWSSEKGFFQKTARLALSLCYLFPNSVKRNFSKKEIRWIDLLIDKHLRILLAQGTLKHAVSELLQLVGKDLFEFENLIVKIHSPLTHPVAEEPLQALGGQWMDQAALSSFEARERFAKYLAETKFLYLGKFFKNYSNEEKKSFDLFLHAFALESQCRFFEQPFRKALFLAARRHPVKEMAILSLIAKYEAEEALFPETRKRAMSEAAEGIYTQIVSLPFTQSEIFFELLSDASASSENQGSSNEKVGFFSFMRALDLLVRGETPLFAAWEQMLRPEAMERYFLSKSYEKNLKTLLEHLEIAAPKVLIDYSKENPEAWLEEILQKASELEPVQFAITPEQKLLQRLQLHRESSISAMEGIYALFSDIALRRIYASWDAGKNAEKTELFLANLLKETS